MASFVTSLIVLAATSCLLLSPSSSGLSIYRPTNYGQYYPPSYQTYDRRLIDAFRSVARPVPYKSYELPAYSPVKEYQPAYYGSQTRTAYGGANLGPMSLIYPISNLPEPVYQPVKDDYAQTRPYTASIYDPCSGLPEGDYALQGEFVQLFPGIDAQCNFVKCANYKAYVNPCSVGTKNGIDGGPDPKYGFCASLDYDHYCGVYPASSDP